ncbi:heme oxygenase [Haematococcus lacustris]
MSNVNVSSSPSSLTEELKIASRRIHSLSNSLLNARLIVLFTDRKLYARAISCFFYIFEALDAALAGAVNKEPALQPFASLLPDLYRHEAFATDLELFLGKDWRAACPPSPQVLKYTQHLAQLAAEQPTLLLAHSFTQHLAVLSGGQIIKRAARKKLRLAEQEGTAAYEYKASPSQLKQAFCSALDAWGAGQSAEMRQLMVAEHKAAFAFNNDIISSFRIGWGPFLKGVALLVPDSARIPLVAVGLCGAIAYSGHQLMARGR